MKIKVFPLNKKGKIELTPEELQALVDEATKEYWNTGLTITSTEIPSAITTICNN